MPMDRGETDGVEAEQEKVVLDADMAEREHVTQQKDVVVDSLDDALGRTVLMEEDRGTRSLTPQIEKYLGLPSAMETLRQRAMKCIQWRHHMYLITGRPCWSLRSLDIKYSLHCVFRSHNSHAPLTNHENWPLPPSLHCRHTPRAHHQSTT